MARKLSRMVAKEFEKAIEELSHQQGTDRAEAVHEARKCLKKARAVLLLLKQSLGPDYGMLDERLRVIAHRLSTVRDMDASLAVMKTLRDHRPGIVTGAIFRAVQRGLLARKRGALAHVDLDRLLSRVAREIKQLRTSVQRHICRAAESGAIRAGIERGYRRARKAMVCVRTSPEDVLFHRWRRRVKDHWYHMRLIEDSNAHGQVRTGPLKQLESCLGEDRDLVVLRTIILEAPTRFGDERTTALILGCLVTYQTGLRRRTLKRGEQVFASTTSAFGRLPAVRATCS